MEHKEEKLSPKVEALYKAVAALLLEGREIGKMKVSEITEKAGIGKGTAYEYFESREELLIDAIDYFQRTWAESIEEELSHYDGFMKKVNCLFQLIDEVIGKVKREVLREICNIFFFSPVIKKESHCMVGRLYSIVEEGRRGGELKDEFPDEYIVLALSGKIFSYITYCMSIEYSGKDICTPSRIKTYLLNSIGMEFIRKG